MTGCWAWPTGDPVDPRSWAAYAELVQDLESTDSNGPIPHQLVLNCLDYLLARGDSRTGLSLCERILARRQPPTAPDQRELHIVMYYVNMLRREGRYDEALTTSHDTLDQLTELRPAGHPDVLRAKSEVGKALATVGRYQEAYRSPARTYQPPRSRKILHKHLFRCRLPSPCRNASCQGPRRRDRPALTLAPATHQTGAHTWTTSLTATG